MRSRRWVVRASVLAAVAGVMIAGTRLPGGTAAIGAAPALANDATVQVEYAGSEKATTIANDRIDVSTVTWDLAWSGTIDRLITAVRYSSDGSIFVPRTLTGTTKTTWRRKPEQYRNCTATLSWNPAKKVAFQALFPNAGNDTSRIVIAVSIPDGDLRSSGTGDCNRVGGSYGGGTLDRKLLRTPMAVFSLTTPGAKTPQTFSGSDTYRVAGITNKTVIKETISFGGAACTGAGGSSEHTLLFACYVALGDSFSAGQMPPFVPGGEACLRSMRAYAYLYDRHVAFAACSGARIADVLSNQLSVVKPSTTLATITIGGNDTGIIPRFIICLLSSYSLQACTTGYSPPNFVELHRQLVALYRAIHERAPTAQILVIGYPLVLPPTAPIGCSALYLPHTRIGVFPRDVPYFYKELITLNETIHRAAHDSGVATFVSPDLFFAGHDVCAKASYFFPLKAFDAQTLHPNAAGHAQLAALLRRVAGPPPD